MRCAWATSRRSISSGRPGPSSRPAIPRRPCRSSTRCSASSPRGRSRRSSRARCTRSAASSTRPGAGLATWSGPPRSSRRPRRWVRPATPTVVLRQAQIDVQLGHPDLALARLDRLRARGIGGPGAENLAVLIYEEQGKTTRPASGCERLGPGIPRRPSLPDSRPHSTPRTASPPRPTASSRSSWPAIPTT